MWSFVGYGIVLASLALTAFADEPAATLAPVQVEGHYDNGIGTSDAASAGVITPQLIDDRAILRPGEVLEYIPGMIVTQHSGAGKANQYFLRGFNLDHGTDFDTYVAGMPVNMRTHAHGQGYTDLNFLIPELVSRIDYFKGPYYASEGDFATAGGANISYFHQMKQNVAELTAGSYEYGRALVLGSTEAGPGQFLYAFEAVHENGPWDVPENFRKYNGVLRYTVPVGDGQLGVTAMGYDGQWTATNQVPQRAVNEGLIDRFGSLNSSDGGTSHRYSLSADYAGTVGGGHMLTTAYAISYYLNLYSDFTFFLNDPGQRRSIRAVRQPQGLRLERQLDTRRLALRLPDAEFRWVGYSPGPHCAGRYLRHGAAQASGYGSGGRCPGDKFLALV